MEAKTKPATEATKTEAVDYDAMIAALNLKSAETLPAETLEQEANHEAYLAAKAKTRKHYASLRAQYADGVVDVTKQKRAAAKEADKK